MKMTKRQRLVRRRQAYRLKKKESIINELDIKFNYQAKLGVFEDTLKVKIGRKDKGLTLKTLTKLQKSIKQMPDLPPLQNDPQYFEKMEKEIKGLKTISSINKSQYAKITSEYRDKIRFLQTLPKYKGVTQVELKLMHPMDRGTLLNKINDKYFYEENRELFLEASRERALAKGKWGLAQGKGAASKRLNAEMMKFKIEPNYVPYKKRNQ